MAVEDARQVAAALKKQGFGVRLKTNLNAVELQSTLESFFVIEGADPEARLFVWYAGHGHTIGGEGYLVPADAAETLSEEPGEAIRWPSNNRWRHDRYPGGGSERPIYHHRLQTSYPLGIAHQRDPEPPHRIEMK